MARFKIFSKDGKSVRYEGKPRYNGTYLRPSYLEFSEIASSSPIQWEVGDYIDYPRTGMRYYLYFIPQPTKNARKGSHGRAFTYSGVQLHAATKELEIALFKDLVANDNNIHFSTSPDVTTFEDVYGIARRIQANMDYFFPDRWEIRVAEFNEESEADVFEKIRTGKDFALSGGTCLDALSKIYELWQDIGWSHSYENGKDVITIGYPNKRIEANTTDAYVLGKGNGLTSIKKIQTNKDEFATRLYVYGSERNLPSRYYNGKNILNAESVDIRNLMIPIDQWGITDGLPDARKAYLENAEAVAKYGVIPKTHYFDSVEAGADIHPTVEGMTVGLLRKVLTNMGVSNYIPDVSNYPDDSERVDEIWGSPPLEDDGVLKKDGAEYDFISGKHRIETETPAITTPKGADLVTIAENYTIRKDSFTMNGITRATIKVTSDLVCKVEDSGYDIVRGVLSITEIGTEVDFAFTLNDSGEWEAKLPKIDAEYDRASYIRYDVTLALSVYALPKVTLSSDITTKVNIDAGYTTITAVRLLDQTFTIRLKQIGFDINERAGAGEGKTISMKSGMCEGRNFVITDCRYIESSDIWSLTCKRQQDDTLGMLFPNKDYKIEEGNRFVLLDIALPESYIGVANERLLLEGEKLYAKVSKEVYHYEPSIDAKVMVESGRKIREGMFMEISDEDVVDNTTDYILIDTLNIYEDESAIPTYKVTLKERRKVTYKGTPSATSSTSTKSVEGEEKTESSIYAKESDVNSRLASIKSRLDAAEAITQKFGCDEDGIYTDFNFRTSGELSAGGAGTESEEGEGGTSTGDYKMYHHPQDEAASVWRVEHGLGKFPNVRVLDSNKELCYGDVQYINTSVLTITFGAPFSGDAYCD